MSNHVPQGFSLAGVHCRIKRDPNKLDLTLVVCDRPATGVGVYTQNLVYAAPVALDRSRTPSDRIRAVVICSGVANACTGERGLEDARQMARLAAAAVRRGRRSGPGAFHGRDRRVSADGSHCRGHRGGGQAIGLVAGPPGSGRAGHAHDRHGDQDGRPLGDHRRPHRFKSPASPRGPR